MKHVNAKEALPPDLLREIQRHCRGYVYVPGRDDFYERRRAEVLELHRLGLPTDEIARRVHLCRRRVQQILCRCRAGSRADGQRHDRRPADRG